MISESDSAELATAATAAAGEKTSVSSGEDQPAPPAAPNIVMSSRDHDSLFSGGGISFLSGSRNGRFSYGYSSFKGKRSSMEDFFETRISEVDGQMVAFFGVFDGHGGSRTAEYLKNNLFKNLSSHPNFIKDTKTAIVEAFKQTDVDYLNEEKGHQRDAGSTASTAVLLGDRILVANVGDSRVVACRAGLAVPLSVDHKPDRSDERQRIEQAGGFIIWAGTWRVGGVLAVSRAFGDKLLKPYVVADPEIQEEEIDGVDFIIIASDGLWNVISNEEDLLKEATGDNETICALMISGCPHFKQWDPGGCYHLQWECPLEWEITWIDKIEFLEACHIYNLEDKVALDGVGNVTILVTRRMMTRLILEGDDSTNSRRIYYAFC